MEQKKLTIITLLVVTVGAVGVNEFLIKKVNQDQNREVASFGERYQPEQIKWEQELAKTVSREANSKTVIAARPSVSEKFLFEALEGKYDAVVVDGKLLKISLIENQEPISLNVEQVLKKYSGVFKDAAAFEQKNVDAATYWVYLKNSDGKQIGQVTIRRNTEGRVLDIEIQ